MAVSSGGWGGLVVRLLPFKGAAGVVADIAPALLGSLEGSELRDNFPAFVRHERVNQILLITIALHLEPTRLELKGKHGLRWGGLRRR